MLFRIDKCLFVCFSVVRSRSFYLKFVKGRLSEITTRFWACPRRSFRWISRSGNFISAQAIITLWLNWLGHFACLSTPFVASPTPVKLIPFTFSYLFCLKLLQRIIFHFHTSHTSAWLSPFLQRTLEDEKSVGRWTLGHMLVSRWRPQGLRASEGTVCKDIA